MTLAKQIARVDEGGHGTCFATALACVVGVPFRVLPSMSGAVVRTREGQVALANRWLRSRGKQIWRLALADHRHVFKHLGILDHALPTCILSGVAQDGCNTRHAVVGKYNRRIDMLQFAHDPNKGLYIKWPPDFALFVVPLGAVA